MNTTQIVTLSQTYYTVPPVVHAVQNDTGRILKMIVADQTIPSGSTATLSIWRPDDTHYSINCEFVAADNAFTANITQALTQSGTVKCQLKVSGIVSTYTFNIDVQEDAGGTPTPQEGGSILDALETAQQAVTTANTANETSQAAKAKAEETVDFVDEMVTELNNGTYKSVLTGLSEQLLSSNRVIDQTPYLYRQTALGRANATRALMKKIVGGSVVWNQLVQNGDFSDGLNSWLSITGGSYQSQSVDNGVCTITVLQKSSSIGLGNTNSKVPSLANHKVLFSVFVNPSAASYIRIGSTSAVAGDYGVASLSKAIPANTWTHYTVIGVVAGGNTTKNLLIYPNSSDYLNVNDTIQLKNIAAFDLTAMFGTTIADYIYSIEQATAGSGIAKLKECGFLTEDYYPYDAGTLKSVDGVSAKVTKDAEQNVLGNYPIDSSLTLRGIPKLVDNELVYDGDEYESDGTVTRNTILRVYQSGDEGLANAITDGTNTVVYSANASTETADPYTEVQVVDKDGTEEFVTTGIVPVGHYTEYPEDLVGKLDSIPALPSANGRYVLQATVASGKVTYAWVTA